MPLEVLVVDDDAIFIQLASRLIRMVGLHPEPPAFANGQTALQHLLTASGEKQFLVFLDINMPVMNGWEFLDAVAGTELDGRVEVVIISSSCNQTDKQKAAAYPMVREYLEKPVLRGNFEDLMRNGTLRSLQGKEFGHEEGPSGWT